MSPLFQSLLTCHAPPLTGVLCAGRVVRPYPPCPAADRCAVVDRVQPYPPCPAADRCAVVDRDRPGGDDGLYEDESETAFGDDVSPSQSDYQTQKSSV